MNKSRFLFIDADAAEDISSTRTLQSDEFEQGNLLGNTLLGIVSTPKISSHTYVLKTNSGMYFLCDKGNQSDLLVIDLEEAPLFKDCSSRDALGRFLKLLRFARRRWSRVSPSHNEKLLLGSTKAIIFPYPITTQSSFRISLELSPDKRRREKRANGMEMLAYRIGTDEGGGPQEEAPVTNFRKALEELPEAVKSLTTQVDGSTKSLPSESQIDSLSITRLQSSSVNDGIAGCNFDEWLYYLTDAQKGFIKRELTGPHRIEGPAGTGKTLCLVLKCISQLRLAKSTGAEHRALFVAHSVATRKSIEDMFLPELGGHTSTAFDLQSVKITTLHELCGELLHYEISDSEFLDRDAFESKQSQLLYSVEALQEVISADFNSHLAHMSNGFVTFLKTNDQWNVAEMIQHEISVVIKGRANEDLEKYKRLPKLKYGLPVENAGDKAFTYLIFKAYQRRLQTSGQFDTDDVVLSALHNLDTPIWRRRRGKEGFDSIYIDETHLFNINELSVFHQLTRQPDHFPIAYSADISQSLGDRGWSDVSFNDALLGDGDASHHESSQQTIFKSIFRCSPEIVNLAFSVTSSGATLFTNFHDPLEAASSAFTEDEERKCLQPQYLFYPSDEGMIYSAFTLAEKFASEMGSTRAGVAIVVFGTELFSQTEKAARTSNKPIELLKHRGDMEIVRHARSSGRFILTTPDFVGGLEFDAVILVGVDKGRVPPALTKDSSESDNFVSYATYQRLYVAITRARYRVAILGVKARGVSDVLANAVSHNILEII